MAKIGEGDSRWIVEHRDDGANVNSWHWSEKDITPWAKRRVKELLVGNIKVTGVPGKAEVKSLIKVDGDATVYNRKGGLKTVYDLTITGKWEGSDNSEEVTRGEFKLEVFDEDPEIFITVEYGTKNDRAFKELMEKEGIPLIHAQMEIFAGEAKHGGDVKLETPDKPEETETRKETLKSTEPLPSTATSTQKTTTSVKNVNEAHDLRIEDQFRTSSNELYLAFIDERRVKGYTGQNCEISQEEKGAFMLCNGLVRGTQIKLEKGQRIHQKWRMEKWNAGTYSDVKMDFSEDEDGLAKLVLSQTGIPAEHRYETEEHWRRAILERMKVVLGIGTARYI